ncbi:MAG: hypothetical protein Q8M09_11800 [Pseudomonadota bacterium]|nr:hypothetical protein [Pseudomonadota bacterium]MDP1904913.1 hypothetical protein [Pseudomonadota bacterium]MDP2352036.1 hypothetical protein [Pseudomonadota bacterium]
MSQHSEIDESGRVIHALLEQIDQLKADLKRQERFYEQEKSAWLAGSVQGLVSQFRMHETILLHLGNLDNGHLADAMVRGGQPGDVVEAALLHAFYLARASLSPEVITAVREAANHGMRRWQ